MHFFTIKTLNKDKTIIILSILFAVCSFLVRFNFSFFHNLTGFLEGEILYFYLQYGDNIQNSIFYPIEYPVGFIFIQKISYFLSVFLFNTFNYPSFILSHTILMVPLIVLVILLTRQIAQEIYPSRK